MHELKRLERLTTTNTCSQESEKATLATVSQVKFTHPSLVSGPTGWTDFFSAEFPTNHQMLSVLLYLFHPRC